MINLQAYEPPLSIWELVKQHIADSEQPEVKLCLGEDLIEQSYELRNEISTMLEIISDFHASESNKNISPNKFPELPDIKQNIMREIISFVEGIREQAKVNGRDVTKIFQKHDKELIDYAYESGSSRPSTSDGSRPSTAYSSSQMRMTPLSSSRSGSVTSREEVVSMQDKFNYLEFDEVRQRLQQYLQEEVDKLVEDLSDIQNSLCDGDGSQPPVSSREPTLLELKEERSKLEKTLLETSRSLPAMPDVKSLHHKPNNKRVPGPVKASHTFIPCQVISQKCEIQANNNNNNVSLPKRTGSPVSTTSQDRSSRSKQKTPPNNSQVNNSSPNVIDPSTSPTTISPTQSRPGSSFRPSSAQRFRNMVLNCRMSDETDSS